MLASCSRREETPQQTKKESTSPLRDALEKVQITPSDMENKFTISTTFLKGRDVLKYVKRPSQDVEIAEQIFSDPKTKSDAAKIILLILKYASLDSAKEETRINFSILESLLKKSEFSVKEFAINVFGEESMGIVFSGRKYPLFLYCRIGDVLIKVNGSDTSTMKDLIQVVKIIEKKMNKK